MGDKVLTPRFRLSFPHIFTPQPSKKAGQDPMYNMVMLFPASTDLSVMKKAAMAEANISWPDGKRPANFRSPFRDGNTKDIDGYKDHIFVTAKSKSKPGVVDQNVQPIINAGDIYAGCWCVATVNAYTYNQDGNVGVAFGLMNIQKVADAPPFGNRSKPEDDFTVVAGAQKAAGAKPAAAGAVDDGFGTAAAGAPRNDPDFL